eukprot:scaffold15947_cov14-Tisochrysis_lutea.AAC.1
MTDAAGWSSSSAHLIQLHACLLGSVRVVLSGAEVPKALPNLCVTHPWCFAPAEGQERGSCAPPLKGGMIIRKSIFKDILRGNSARILFRTPGRQN